MIYEDLSECTYSSDSFTENPTAVGWLGDRPYPTGQVSDGSVKKLIEVYTDSPFRRELCYRGMHPCPFCGAMAMTETPFGPIHIGAGNILLPSQDQLFYAPSTVIHYILEHDYLPPAVFMAALDAADLDHPSFVDLIARTYVMSRPESYSTWLGELITRRAGLLGEFGLWSKLFDLQQEKIPAARGSWPPPGGVSADVAEEIALIFQEWKSKEVNHAKTLFRQYEGTKWQEPLETYLELYDAI